MSATFGINPAPETITQVVPRPATEPPPSGLRDLVRPQIELLPAHARVDASLLELAARLPITWVVMLDADVDASIFEDVLGAVDRALGRSANRDAASLELFVDALVGMAGMAVAANKAAIALARVNRASPYVLMASKAARSRFWLARGALLRVLGEMIDAERCFNAVLEVVADGEIAAIARIARAAALIRCDRPNDAVDALTPVLRGEDAALRAEARRVLAVARVEAGFPEEALDLAREALAEHVAIESMPRPTFVLLVYALLAESGQVAEARAHLLAARAGFEAAGRKRWVALCDTNLGSTAFETGELESALAAYDGAATAFAEQQDAHEASLALGYGGLAAFMMGDLPLAIEKLERALITGARVSGPPNRFFNAALAVVLSTQSGTSRERLSSLMGRGPADGTTLLLQHAVQISTAAREKRPNAVRRARAALAQARLTRSTTFHHRLAMRVLAHVLDTEARRDARVLRVARDGSWFESSTGRHDLTTRIVLRRILLALVASAESAPGSLVTTPELITAGWPNERILPAAARGRLRVAICTLRKFGLREFLVSNRHGHAVETRVELVDA